MDLQTVLESLSTEKTAAAKAAEKETVKTASDSRLSQALEAAISELNAGSEKTASAPGGASPVDDITKIAARIATAEQEALKKEAELYGAALCDGFVTRMSQYERAGVTKTASHSGPVNQQSFTKFASENPELVKQAMELGYRETKAQLEKVAQDAYAAGYQKTAEAIKTAAENCAVRGFNKAVKVLQSLPR